MIGTALKEFSWWHKRRLELMTLLQSVKGYCYPHPSKRSRILFTGSSMGDNINLLSTRKNE